MSEEKPLHVRVAEALGCKPFQHDDRWFCEPAGCQGGEVVHYQDGTHHSGDFGALLEYDTDWSATGPLIEKYGLSVAPMGEEWRAELNVQNGYAVTDRHPLLAICRLVLALKAAGKQ